MKTPFSNSSGIVCIGPEISSLFIMRFTIQRMKPCYWFEWLYKRDKTYNGLYGFGFQNVTVNVGSINRAAALTKFSYKKYTCASPGQKKVSL